MTRQGGWPETGFGTALRANREAKGWTQKQLGEAADIHPNTIAKLERGDQEPAWPLVLALAKALGVDCTAFTAGQVEEPEPPAAAKGSRGGAGKRGKGK